MAKLKPRPRKPKPFRLTDRDKAILEAIYHFEGLMSRRQIARLFFGGVDGSPARTRLRLLFENGYLLQPDSELIHRVPEMVYWLDKAGLEVVAGLHGDDPLYHELRKRDAPKWSTVEHDLAVNDFRLAVMEACEMYPGFELETWLSSWELAAHTDTVEFIGQDGKKTRREIRPDGYCVIRSPQGRSRLLLEIDRASEDNPRFVREKVLPGVAYLRSDTYEKRFGYKSGRWLVVTAGEKRLPNMKRQAELAVGKDARAFYFTTFDRVMTETILTAPIWLQGGDEQPIPLFETTVYANP